MEPTRTPTTRRRPGHAGRGAATLLLATLVAWSAQGSGKAADALSLAEALAAEGQWSLAGAECRRVLLGVPDTATAGRARLLAARAQARRPDAGAAAVAALEELWRNADLDTEIRCAAAVEWGRLWAAEAPREAGDALNFAYFQTRDTATFHQAGRALFALLRKNRALRREQPLAWQTLQSCRGTWPADSMAVRPPSTRFTWQTLPGRLIGGFYRRQIGPAIGMRCELHPSCSAYLLEACQAHGLLGFSLLADRLVREPSVAAAREQTVTLPDGRTRTADPLRAHDFWMGTTP